MINCGGHCTPPAGETATRPQSQQSLRTSRRPCGRPESGIPDGILSSPICPRGAQLLLYGSGTRCLWIRIRNWLEPGAMQRREIHGQGHKSSPEILEIQLWRAELGANWIQHPGLEVLVIPEATLAIWENEVLLRGGRRNIPPRFRRGSERASGNHRRQKQTTGRDARRHPESISADSD
jgi:hypothetical protein